MQRFDTMEDLAGAVGQLCTIEPRFRQVVDRHGLPPLRHAPASLETLLRIVTDQLISLRAGEAIWARLSRAIDGFTPQGVLALSEQDLRALGLSGAKARSFHAAARAFAAKRFSHPESMSEEELLRRLTDIPGVGPWTANIFLMTALRAVDAWPAADLALQLGAQDLLSLPGRPSTVELTRLAIPWRPYRSAAALLLWRHYRGLRGIPSE